jgi:hypothetical protein
VRGRKEPRLDTVGLFAPQVRWELKREMKPSEVKIKLLSRRRKDKLSLSILGIAADAGDELSCNWYWIPLIRTLIGSVLVGRDDRRAGSEVG